MASHYNFRKLNLTILAVLYCTAHVLICQLVQLAVSLPLSKCKMQKSLQEQFQSSCFIELPNNIITIFSTNYYGETAVTIVISVVSTKVEPQ